MANLVPPSRSLISSPARSTLCQSCAFRLTTPAVRNNFVEAVGRSWKSWTKSESDLEEQAQQRREQQRKKDELDKRIAKLETEAPNKYRFAETWDGLPWVGSKNYVWQHTPLKLPKEATTRWAPREALPLERIEKSFVLALVDTILLHYARPLASQAVEAPIPLTLQYHSTFLQKASIVNIDGHPSITFASKQAFEQCIQYIQALGCSRQEAQTLVDKQIVTLSPNKGAIPLSSASSWGNISLADHSLRWLLLTRIFKRTGHRMPDHALRTCSTADAMFQLLTTKPAEKTKLAERIADDGQLNLPNVSMSDKRFTKIHEDIALGRWKLTRKELKKLGLPELWTIGRQKAMKSIPIDNNRELEKLQKGVDGGSGVAIPQPS